MIFDDKKDGVDRCGAFIAALHAIMKEHRVKVIGHSLNLQQIELCHDDNENGWRLDMRDVQSLTDGKSR